MIFSSRFIVLWLLLSLGGTTVFSANYVKEFGADWTSAASYAAQHRAEWQAVFADFGAAGYSDLRAKESAFAHLHIMRHLH